MASEKQTRTSNEELVTRKQAADRFLNAIKAFERTQRHEALCWQLLGLSIAVASIILSIYGSVIAESRVDFLHVLRMPAEPQRINLSELTAKNTFREEVFIFALDVSGSLTEQDVSLEDGRIFVERIQQQHEGAAIPSGCLVKEIGEGKIQNLNQWHLAKAQLCCYIDSFKEGPRLGIRTFGSTVERIGTADAIKFEKNQNNFIIVAKEQLKEALMNAPQPTKTSTNYYHTNFDALLDNLQSKFIDNDDYKNMELHFVILSDFEHDIGSRSALSYEWSMEKIATTFSNISKRQNVMFHLATTRGAHNEIRSVVRVVEETMGWYQHKTERFDRPTIDSGREFFHSFESQDRDLTFFYPIDTSKFQPVHLVWDRGMPSMENAKVIIGLMADVYGKADDTVAIHMAEGHPSNPCAQPAQPNQVSQESNETMQQAVLRFKGRTTFEIERPEDYVCLQPLSIDANNRYGYRLTLSQIGPGASRRTSVIHLNFQPVLPEPAYYTLVGCTIVGGVALLVLLSCWGHDLYQWNRRRAEGKKNQPHLSPADAIE